MIVSPSVIVCTRYVVRDTGELHGIPIAVSGSGHTIKQVNSLDALSSIFKNVRLKSGSQ